MYEIKSIFRNRIAFCLVLYLNLFVVCFCRNNIQISKGFGIKRASNDDINSFFIDNGGKCDEFSISIFCDPIELQVERLFFDFKTKKPNLVHSYSGVVVDITKKIYQAYNGISGGIAGDSISKSDLAVLVTSDVIEGNIESFRFISIINEIIAIGISKVKFESYYSPSWVENSQTPENPKSFEFKSWGISSCTWNYISTFIGVYSKLSTLYFPVEIRLKSYAGISLGVAFHIDIEVIDIYENEIYIAPIIKSETRRINQDWEIVRLQNISLTPSSCLRIEGDIFNHDKVKISAFLKISYFEYGGSWSTRYIDNLFLEPIDIAENAATFGFELVIFN